MDELLEPMYTFSLQPSLQGVLLSFLACVCVFTPLEYFFPAKKNQSKTNRAKFLDMTYWIFTPVVTRTFSNVVLGVAICLLCLSVGKEIDTSVFEGFGPIGGQALWVQAIEILILADFIEYWTHRLFHGRTLWKFHAIHHSPNEMDWISSSRMHPVNDLIGKLFQVIPLITMGFAANAILYVIPYLFFYVVFLHSNVCCDFGLLRFVLVSPAYHRWHHASDDEALDKNFAGMFPIWDILFGTLHFPKRLPENYGVKNELLPESLAAQLAYPFRKGLPFQR